MEFQAPLINQRIEQDAGDAIVKIRVTGADPMLQGEIAQAVVAGIFHERIPAQQHYGQHRH